MSERGCSCSWNLPISGVSDNGQPGDLAQQARRRAIHQGHQKEEEDGAVQTHDEMEAQALPGVEAPFQEIRKDEEDVEGNGLHGVEPDVPAEIGVSDDGEVEGEEHQEAIQGEALEDPDGWGQGLNQGLEGSELGDDVPAVLDAVEEGVEVTDG